MEMQSARKQNEISAIEGCSHHRRTNLSVGEITLTIVLFINSVIVQRVGPSICVTSRTLGEEENAL